MKAALAQYEVDIQMSADTVQALMQNGFGLSVFKAVQAPQVGGMPLLWFQTNQLLVNTVVTWQDQYQAYVSMSHIIPNGVIQANSTVSLALGQTGLVNQNGAMTIGDGGTPSAISILNQSNQPWTCGPLQVVEGQANPLCGVPLYGQNMVVIAPVEKVLLVFANTPINAGTVVYRSSAPGLLVDLTGASQRTVQYDINMGWSWDGSSWAQQVPAMSNLVPLLIQPPGA